MMHIVLVVLVVLIVLAGEPPLKTEPVGSVEIPADAVPPQARMSQNGRWWVGAQGVRMDEGRKVQKRWQLSVHRVR